MPLQYRVEWAGVAGGGLTVLNFRTRGGSTTSAAADDCPVLAQSLFKKMEALIPNDVTLNFPAEVQELDTSTGQLLGVFPVTSPASVPGTDPGPYAAPAGGRIDWLTPAIVAGKRLRGRTYVVPMATGTYSGTGDLTSAAISLMSLSASEYLSEGFLTDAEPVVWSRTHGILADITAVTIPDQVAVLRGRRD